MRFAGTSGWGGFGWASSGTFPAMPSPPRIIADRYRVLEEAGRGGMGSVWRCVDERLGREVAVKQVGRMPGESVTDQARALREARSSAALNHPNVVSVYDAVAEGDHVWLVMEYVPGRTLAQILREEGALPPPGRPGSVPRSPTGWPRPTRVAPSTVTSSPATSSSRTTTVRRISDFGIARTAGDDTLTQSGMLTGTPNYLAPEVARGGEPRPASDVWALGATLFAAVEGRAPYDTNPNALAVLATIAAEEPPAPERAGPLTEPIRRMLDRDPDSRWSMGDVAHALHQLHDQHAAPTDTREETQASGAAVPRPPAAARTRARAGTHRPAAGGSHAAGSRAVLVAALVMLLVVAIAVLALLRDGGESPAADEEPSGAPSDTGESPRRLRRAPESSATTSRRPPSPARRPASRRPRAEAAGPPSSRTTTPTCPRTRRAGYALLTPSYQEETSYESYDGFWSTIDEVAVQGTDPAGAGAVDVTLLYDGEDEEVRRIYLERGDDGWLIADDEIVG